ncbi:ABC transporter ATP-binding protein [Actinopolymorpha alba]|uniref:dipeptide ABC transporter ATP-binding protein n=1 Tax=Actinopolymorpha alba TaxID=533267 RepID=UPI0003777478|nr:ABC transporter ATP-binding protein [Actinopolymorpha alba]
MTPPLLEVRGLTVDFETAEGRVQALRDLSLTIERGETVGLIGESGSGKSTAGKAILRLLAPTARMSGGLAFQGRDLAAVPSGDFRKLRWRELAFVPQAAMNSLDPVHRVDRQLMEVLRTHQPMSRREARRRAHEALESVGIRADRASDYPHQFSGGMRQRALIAMATLLRPALLVADEPTTGLDVVVQDRILELLEKVKQDMGLGLLLITHDLGVAAELCDRVHVLRQGMTVESGTVAQVFGQPRDPYTRRLLGNAPADGRRPEDDGVDGESRPTPTRQAIVVEDVAIRYATGRGMAALARRHEVSAVDGVSLTVHEGEVFGLAGESGCGKSSLASALVGLAPLAAGSARLGETEIGALSGRGWRAVRPEIQFIFQDPFQSLNPRFTVERSVAEPLLAQTRLSPDEVREWVLWALDAAELKPVDRYLSRRPHQLSGGERQRVAIARALVVRPRVLLADEPVSMLDRSIGRDVVDLLRRLADDLGVAVLLISHDLSVLARACDRLGVMYLGRLVEVGPTREVLDHPRHPYTHALVRAVPSEDPNHRRPHLLLPGELPSAMNRPAGCAFHPRCERADTDDCRRVTPDLLGNGHRVACWHPHDQAGQSILPAPEKSTTERSTT